jgi:hypothetical protein
VRASTHAALAALAARSACSRPAPAGAPAPAPPNRAARAFGDAEDGRNPALYPSAEPMGRLQFVTDLGERNRLHDQAWARVTSR